MTGADLSFLEACCCGVIAACLGVFLIVTAVTAYEAIRHLRRNCHRKTLFNVSCYATGLLLSVFMATIAARKDDPGVFSLFVFFCLVTLDGLFGILL